MSFVEAAKTSVMPPATMQHAGAGGTALCIINAVGTFFVIGDRCHDMNARLSIWTLRGNILTCAYRFSRSGSTTGKRIPGPEIACRPCTAEVVCG